MNRASQLFIGFAFVLAATAAGHLRSGSAAPVRLARTPDYHEGKIAFSYLGDIWVFQRGWQQHSPSHGQCGAGHRSPLQPGREMDRVLFGAVWELRRVRHSRGRWTPGNSHSIAATTRWSAGRRFEAGRLSSVSRRRCFPGRCHALSGAGGRRPVKPPAHRLGLVGSYSADGKRLPSIAIQASGRESTTAAAIPPTCGLPTSIKKPPRRSWPRQTITASGRCSPATTRSTSWAIPCPTRRMSSRQPRGDAEPQQHLQDLAQIRARQCK